MNESEKRAAKKEAGEIVVDEINRFLDASESPVSGGRFKEKKADGGRSRLFEDGDMRSQISFEELESDHIAVGIFENAPTVEKLKSYNHNVGDTLPKRQFIAAPNRKFRPEIMEKVATVEKKYQEISKERKKQDQDLVQSILTEEDILGLL